MNWFVVLCLVASLAIGFGLLKSSKTKVKAFQGNALWSGGDRSAPVGAPIYTSSVPLQSGGGLNATHVVEVITEEPEITWVSLDCETTGLNENENGIISIGVVVLFPDGVRQERMFEMDPRFPGCVISQDALRINGYSEVDFDTFEKPEVVMKKLVSFFQALPGDWRLVGSNPDFDVRFFNATLKRCGIGYKLTVRNVYDVAKLALRAHDKGLITLPLATNGDVKTNLNVISQVLGLGAQGTIHGALKDARLALDAFLMLW